jgi:hypothetical protein
MDPGLRIDQCCAVCLTEGALAVGTVEVFQHSYRRLYLPIRPSSGAPGRVRQRSVSHEQHIHKRRQP